jgi:hypothetical protein
LSLAQCLLDQQKLPAPVYSSVYLATRFLKDIYSLKRQLADQFKIDSNLKKKAWLNGKESLKILKNMCHIGPKSSA